MLELRLATLWNATASPHNQWQSLSLDEKFTFAFQQGYKEMQEKVASKVWRLDPKLIELVDEIRRMK